MNLKQTFLTATLMCILNVMLAQVDTIVLGNQIWLKNNLDVQVKGAAYYDFDAQKYKSYGKLYTWQEADKACPAGWHLPTQEEFKQLLKEAKKSRKSVYEFLTDEKGFNAKLSGFIFGVSSRNVGLEGNYWSATEMKDGGGAYLIHLDKNKKKVKLMAAQTSFRYSVRCIKD